MSRIRVLIVDDAVVIRRLVADALAADPSLQVVGTAANGRIALDKIAQLAPDVVTLDVEMPVMDGIETLTALRERHPRLPVIMFSTLTERGAAITVEALLHGANDYVTKPSNVGSVTEAQARIRDTLIPKVHALAVRARRTSALAPRPHPSSLRPASAPVQVPPAAPARSDVRAGSRLRPRGPAARVELIVVGVSTGGPNALASLVPSLPATLRVPVLVVQHMPATFTRLLAQRLDATSPLTVREASDGEPLRRGHVLFAPGDRHLAVRRHDGSRVLELLDGPPENSCRPAADVLFRTAAETVGAGVLGVVLTGMGVDGRRGAEHIVEGGGRVLVQDEASSVVWGMPGSVAQAGLADEVLPLTALPAALVRRVAAPTRPSAPRRTREVAR